MSHNASNTRFKFTGTNKTRQKSKFVLLLRFKMSNLACYSLYNVLSFTLMFYLAFMVLTLNSTGLY